jgi:hypothetical protein
MNAAGMPVGPGDVDRPVSSSPESLMQIGWRRVDEIGSPWPGIGRLTGPLLLDLRQGTPYIDHRRLSSKIVRGTLVAGDG